MVIFYPAFLADVRFAAMFFRDSEKFGFVEIIGKLF
jgi:hypothetical protein